MIFTKMSHSKTELKISKMYKVNSFSYNIRVILITLKLLHAILDEVSLPTKRCPYRRAAERIRRAGSKILF